MMPRRPRPAVALAALVCALNLPSPARAQSKADAFAGKIPPVSGQLYRKAGRFEVTASGNLSLNDAFFEKYFGGLKAGYHFTESLSVAAHGAGGFATKSDSAVRCRPDGCDPATDDMMRSVPGRIRWIVGAEAAWSPVYGKLNVLAEHVAHFDLSIFAGPDLIAHDEILFQEEVAALGGRDPNVVTSVGGHAGLGARLFFAQWLALRLEVKDYVYVAEVPENPADAARGRKSDLQNQLFAEIGLSFFVPTRNRPTR